MYNQLHLVGLRQSLALMPRLVSNLGSSCFSFPSASIAGKGCRAWHGFILNSSSPLSSLTSILRRLVDYPPAGLFSISHGTSTGSVPVGLRFILSVLWAVPSISKKRLFKIPFRSCTCINFRPSIARESHRTFSSAALRNC